MDIRGRIIMACKELARLQGFYNMNMDELASRAGVSKRTVYRYYRSKEEIIEAVLDEFMADMQNEFNRLAEADTEPMILFTNMMRKILSTQYLINNLALADLRQHYPQLWHKVDSFRMERLRFALDYMDTRSNNQLFGEFNPHIVIAVILASIQAVLNPSFILENNLTFEECALQISKLFTAVFA